MRQADGLRPVSEAMNPWIGLYWTWLLPALALLPALLGLRRLRRARALELIKPLGVRWTLAGLCAAQSLILLSHAAVVYPAAAWLPAGALAALATMAVAARAARSHFHPGLRGLQRNLPPDGLALIEGDQPSAQRPAGLRAPAGIAALLPAVMLTLYLAAALPHRRWELIMFGVTLAAPYLVIPYRRGWAAPLLLTGPLVIVLAQALLLGHRLPQGLWATPVVGAHCPGILKTSGREVWCADPASGAIFKVDLATGIAPVEARIPEAALVFAANSRRAWVQQYPIQGLVVLSAGRAEPEHLPVISAHAGAADEQDRLWIIDVGSELTLYENGAARPLRSRDGLLNNTARAVKVSPHGDVWVGSPGGASRLPVGQTQWQTFPNPAGPRREITNIAFGEGVIWLMWTGPARGSWGLVKLRADGTPLAQTDAGQLTGLEAPLGEDAMAADGLGRLWLVTQSIVRREKYLVVVTLAGAASAEVYPLGGFPTAGPFQFGGAFWRDGYGVASDGAGGILLYNADMEPWRWWRP